MKEYDFIIKTVHEAGELLLKKTKGGFKVGMKGDDPRNIVTEVDLEISDYIAREIKKKFPLHGIYSEEGLDVENEREYVWTIDPIDGTSNFVRGIPHYSICIGLLRNNIPVTGAVYNPVTKELFSFKKGEGAFFNKKKIRVSAETELSKAGVFFHGGRKIELRKWGGKVYEQLLENALKTSNFASSALDTCYVACGRIEASIYGQFTSFDISCAIGILLEAGGLVADKDGRELKLSKTPQIVVIANNSKIKNQIVKIIN